MIKATVYRLFDKETCKTIYVGSTTQDLHVRYKAHISNLKNGNTANIYKAIRKLGIDFGVDIVESVLVKNRKELRCIEYAWIGKYESTGCVVYNSIRKPQVVGLNFESVKIEKKIVDKVRRLKKKDSSINIGGFIGNAVNEKLNSLKKPLQQQPPSYINGIPQ